MIGYIITALILLCAILYLGRIIYKAFFGKGGSCGCGCSCSDKSCSTKKSDKEG